MIVVGKISIWCAQRARFATPTDSVHTSALHSFLLIIVIIIIMIKPVTVTNVNQIKLVFLYSKIVYYFANTKMTGKKMYYVNDIYIE